MSNHRFIAFEGGEGVGKTTQIKLLTKKLEQTNTTFHLTREPGATELGKDIREMLLNPNLTVDPKAEALLYAADRAEHAKIMREQLKSGHIVCDRYIDSSIVYQGMARGLGVEQIRNLSLWASDNLIPDLTIILDADPNISLQRSTKTEFGVKDRIEKEDLSFHIKVREGFLKLAQMDKQRYFVVDATLEPQQIHGIIYQKISELI